MAKGYGTKSKSNIGMKSSMKTKDMEHHVDSPKDVHSSMKHENIIGVKARGFGMKSSGEGNPRMGYTGIGSANQ